MMIQRQNCAFLEQLVVSNVKINPVSEEEEVRLPLMLPCPAQGQEDSLNCRGGISRAVFTFSLSAFV